MNKKHLLSKFILSLFLPLFITIFSFTSSAAAVPSSQEELLKNQIKLFQEAIDYLKISTPQEAARLWAEAKRTRNGVLQYRAACSNLRKQLINSWGSPENNIWVIGVSSPWITSFELSEPIHINKDSCMIFVTYNMASSSGQEKPERSQIKLIRSGGQWCIEEEVTKED